MQANESINAGISRSGRLRKKSTKLIEMEETEKDGDTPIAGKSDRNCVMKTPKSSLLANNSSNNNCSILQTTNFDYDSDRSSKKNLKIKLSLGGRSIEQIGNCVVSETPKAVIPPVKIKLLNNSLKTGEATIVTSPNANSVKKAARKSPVKSEPLLDSDSFNSTHKTIKQVNKKANDTNESAANLLFKQITAGVASNDGLKKRKKTKLDEVYFTSDDMDEDEASLVIEDSNHSIAAAVANAKKVKNPKTPKTSIEKREERRLKQKIKAENRTNAQEGKEKKKRAPLVTAYTLFAREQRPKILEVDPDMDFSSLSKRLGEVWQALPPKEKLRWKKRALKLKEGNAAQETTENNVSKLRNSSTPTVHATSTTTTTTTVPVRVSHRHSPSKPASSSLPSRLSTSEHTTSSNLLLSQNDEPHVIGTGPSDVAAHLRLLGESLSIIGQRLTEHSGQIAVSGSLSVLLDSTVCALGPLLCLTTLDENLNGCPQEVHKQTLDNISYIMPGI